MEPFNPLADLVGTVRANPNNWNDAVPYQEYAVRMQFVDDMAWFVINTKHGGAYSSGVELVSWPAMGVFTGPVGI